MIYKYKGLNKESKKHHLSILVDTKLFFCMGKKLNDPFEGQMIGNKMIQNLFQNSGICSFSRVSDNLLMWSHYGNSHNGICYGFDKKTLEDSIWENVSSGGEKFLESGEVLYANSPPNVLGEKLEDFNAKDIVFHKSLGWSYEQEFRIVISTQRELNYNKAALKRVIIGAHVPLWHPEYNDVWEAIGGLREDVTIMKYELNQNAYGLISNNSWSPEAFLKEYKKK